MPSLIASAAFAAPAALRIVPSRAARRPRPADDPRLAEALDRIAALEADNADLRARLDAALAALAGG